MPTGFLVLLTVYTRYEAFWGVVERWPDVASLVQAHVTGTKRLPRPGVRKRHVDGQVLREMADAYSDGATIRQVAERFGVDRERVSGLLKQSGIRVRDHEPVEVDLVLAAELEAQGLNTADVAKALGVGRTTLVRARRAARQRNGQTG